MCLGGFTHRGSLALLNHTFEAKTVVFHKSADVQDQRDSTSPMMVAPE